MSQRFLCLFLLVACSYSCKKENFKPVEISSKRFSIDSNIPSETSIANFIKPYSEHINRSLDSTIAFNPLNLDKKDGELNTALGNLMADIVMEQANLPFKDQTGKEIDIVLLNHGGIRAAIDKGPVTARTAYQLMPFENEIVVAELTGNRIKEMIAYLENNRTAHPISGMTIKMDEDFKVINAEVQNLPIEDEKKYFVATSDYLQQGGDNMIFLKDPVNLYRTGYKIRNAIIDYFNKIDTIQTQRDGRYIRITN
ncbi:5'-nucleotidase C-terminal domain-containing protein [Antarcticibacterium sp. 1MA-6-2]|uniref:5'-nucleotidase C-terminal domain-containing protein n=1 Tax=Antarcticibacterium sp. 1MA-6-2 TaxID=2908210 RepID=UPI001F459C90|nr:5'-nucleotidase [Antarcticibacterium sp. 1MA-6-2]UJH91182.1 5'-nucleotidase C-terminal domain-containing protein [Antarcticibacterium sp. 1MA-6-2]